jgi:electron transfer flavoprotein beta subunit
VLCGRQAIDGDTAQVGPQLAEKLGIPQITYVEELIDLTERSITVRRNIGNGWQKVRGKLPILLTVTSEANTPRATAAKKMMRWKKAITPVEIRQKVSAENSGADKDTINSLAERKMETLEGKGLLIKQWDLDYLGANLKWCGRDGSPTKVHRIQSVVLGAKESKNIEPTDEGVAGVIHELLEDKIIA